MQFSSDAVRHALALLEPGPHPPGEAARLAALTGSWPELLAHLLLRRDSFAACPEITTAIHRHSAACRGGPASPRAETADLLRMQQTSADLETTLVAVLAAEAERTAVADRAAGAWRAHAGARPAGSMDLPLRIATEPRQ
jgi:hypothetical protein